MDYEKLKEVIAKQIKENGQREITGPVLQAVLMAMVDSLGEVYPHTYTDEEKAQARANIDALSNHNGEITKEKLSLEVQAILNDVANKQNISDATLATIAKTIVGAINEVYKGGLEDASIATSKIKDGAITEPKLDTDLVNIITSAVQPAELASAIATALASYVAKADIVDTTGSATDKVMSQHGVTEAIDGVTNKVTELEGEIKDLAGATEKFITFSIIKNEYVQNTDGTFLSYNGWDRTDYIDIHDTITITSNLSFPYNAVYDKDKHFIGFVQYTPNVPIAITSLWSQNAYYVVLSGTAANIEQLQIRAEVHPKEYSLFGIHEDILARNQAEIVMPSSISILHGEQYDLHFNNVVMGADSHLMPYKTISGDVPFFSMKNLARIPSMDRNVDCNGEVLMLNHYDLDNKYGYRDRLLRKPFVIHNVSVSAGSGTTRRVMFLGDSITANGIYPNEVKNLFSNSSEPMNITLVGTLGLEGIAGNLHEGRGGWSSATYLTKQSHNGNTNAFWNPSTNTFDFTYYMQSKGFSGIDDVFINLGINDIGEGLSNNTIVNNYKTIISSIRSYNSSAKIFIGLCILPADYEYCTAHNYFEVEKMKRLSLHKALIAEFDNRENEGYYLVPFNQNIDFRNDFGEVEEARLSKRNAKIVTYAKDIIHPSYRDLQNPAYCKMADLCHWYIKYAEM